MRSIPGTFKIAFITAAAVGFLTFSFGAGAKDNSGVRVAALPTPTLSPTATPLPSPTVAKQTLGELQTRIAGSLARPDVLRGQIGLKIVSLKSGKVIFEQNGEKYLMPASNMKNFTVAAAMEKLTPDFKFVTSVYANSQPDASGTIRGDLRIYGRGDVSISTAFFGTSASDPETYYKGIDRLADKIVSVGVKRIEGDLIGDESYFRGNAIPGSWEYDDLQWYYGAEISAFPINDSAVDLGVKPGTVGSPCVVRLLPANPVMSLDNKCTTTGAGITRSLEINKKPNQNVIEITGTLPVGDNGFSGSIAVSHPADLFMAMLKERLVKRGIAITGQTRTVNFESKARVNSPASRTLTNFGTQPTVPTQSVPVEIARLESPPFSEVAAKTMKPSQNMYTETILWTLGEWERGRLDVPTVGTSVANEIPSPQRDSADLGLSVTKAFRHQIGIPDDAVVQYDGCGLSRHDLITPSAVVQLYTYMAKQSRFAQAWRDSLTIGGVDGTLRNRFKGTAGAGNVRGKTGTIDQVSALSGYLTTAGGEPVVFSAVVNGVPEGPTRTALIDEIILSVVNFSGRIDQ